MKHKDGKTLGDMPKLSYSETLAKQWMSEWWHRWLNGELGKPIYG